MDPRRRGERADAARNRLRVLEAAEHLFARDGIENVSMDAVAAAAGVGKGTVYRRFGDRAGLALALLGERERQLQEELIRGSPPLGPGAPAAERLEAFVDAYVGLLERHGDLIAHAESASPGSRYRAGVFAFWRRHLELLLAEARPRADGAVLAELVLGALGGELYLHLRSQGVPSARVRAAAVSLVQALS